MTVRTRLAASISLLLIASSLLVGWGVLFVSNSYVRRDAHRRIEVIDNLVRKAAADALLQKDELMLISYVNFLREQYPALGQVGISWQNAARARQLSVGQAPGHERVRRHAFDVTDPADPGRRVSVRTLIDMDVLNQMVDNDRKRLLKILLLVSTMTTALGVVFAFVFARSVTAPLRALVKLADDIGTGKLGGRLEWKSPDEMGALVEVFNTMSQRLEDLDETKKNFVSSVTHELRSPLGAIESFLQLIQAKLKSGGDVRQCEEYLQRIQVNVQRLSGFITDLLDVAKIEKGKMECVLKPMRLQDVAVEVCQFFEAKAKQQGVRLMPKLDAVPAVQGDPERLRQVFVNLVSNALKFTPGGGVVELKAEQYREGGQRWVEVAVSDTGRGMAPQDLSRLFQSFSQGRNVAEGVVGTKGTGLGLFIVKSIVEQHGGRIQARSAPGRGMQVLFSVKVAA